MNLPKELKDNFCLMPWLHLYIGTDGKANACCNASITYGSLKGQSISEIWEGEKIQTFRNSLLAGKKDKRCAICYNKEVSGKSSIRTETLEKFKHYIPSAIENKKTKPVYLDIRFSNVCNLKCRTCWHGASSSWFEDAKVLKTNFGEKAIIKATENNSKLIQEVISYSDELEEVYFAGGEPLLMEEHYELLALILEKNYLNTKIRYNTNLSTLVFKGLAVIDYWKKFKNVHISVSIDDLEDRVEVIRKGLKWKKLIENIKQIKENCPHVKFEIAPTISVFNIFSIGKLHQYFVDECLVDDVNSIYLNLLERPNYYNIQVLPTGEKKKVELILNEHIIWLHSKNASSKIIQEFKSIINYLFLKQDEKGLLLLKQKNNQLNVLRKEHLVFDFHTY